MANYLETPLIFYGENPQNQYGGPPGTDEALTMTRRWVTEFGGFLGLRPSDLEAQAGLDLADYKMPGKWAVASCGVNGPLGTMTLGMEAHFLGQYLPWDSHENAALAKQFGFETMVPCAANAWSHENLDNAQTGLHDHMMYRKYGYGRGCSQLAVDVRTGRVTREYALQFIEHNDGIFPFFYMGVHISYVLDRIGMTFEDLEPLLERFTNHDLFTDNDRDYRPILKEFA
jgi:hypothetical protein